MEFLVFCVFLGSGHKGPLNKLQVWGYSDADVNATAPYWPAMFAKLPNRPCAWKAPQLHCLSDVNPSSRLSRVAILLSLFPQLALPRSDLTRCSSNLRKQGLKFFTTCGSRD